MIARMTVIFFIILAIQAGISLTLFPWIGPGLDWGDNVFLAFISQKSGLPILRDIVASGWFRGAVSGLGVVNLYMALTTIMNFSQTVNSLENGK